MDRRTIRNAKKINGFRVGETVYYVLDQEEIEVVKAVVTTWQALADSWGEIDVDGIPETTRRRGVPIRDHDGVGWTYTRSLGKTRDEAIIRRTR